MFRGQKLGIMKRKFRQFLCPAGKPLINFSQMLPIVAESCLPVLVGPVSFNFVRGIETREELWRKKTHDWLRGLFCSVSRDGSHFPRES